MKKSILFSAAAFAAIALVSCGSDATKATDAKEEATQANLIYVVDAENSELAWRGFKKIGLGEHKGTIAIAEGSIGTTDNQVTSGSFTIDMNNIVVTDEGMADESKAKLVDHFKSDDFFNVEQFPTAKFVITAVTAEGVEGNLTIRDVTKNITFPATINVNGDELTAEGSVVINRYDWNINYDKANASLDEKAAAKLKNGLLSENIELSLKIKAKKS